MELKRLFIFIISLLITGISAYSQLLNGTVYDSETKKAVPYASVYVNGTSTGMLTDTNGSFSLNISKTGNLPVAVSAIGYYSMLISDFPADRKLIIYLDPKVIPLKEVIVKSNNATRNRYLSIFKSQFLGASARESTCKIENEDDLAFQYSEEDNVLKVFATKPLIIDNRILGYKITYFLESFVYSPGKETLSILGYSVFNDNTESDKSDTMRVERKRRAVYLGSRMHFFRTLWENNTDSAGYTLLSIENAKLTTESLGIQINGVDKFLPDSLKIKIAFRNLPGSTTLETIRDSVNFDKSGYFDPYGILWSGDMAKQRIADQLPYDYSLDK